MKGDVKLPGTYGGAWNVWCANMPGPELTGQKSVPCLQFEQWEALGDLFLAGPLVI